MERSWIGHPFLRSWGQLKVLEFDTHTFKLKVVWTKNVDEIPCKELTCIKFLVSQHLARCEHEENLNAEEDTNIGNWLLSRMHCWQSTYSMLTKLQEWCLICHQKYRIGVLFVTRNPGLVSYLSPEIKNEIIHNLCQLSPEIQNEMIFNLCQL